MGRKVRRTKRCTPDLSLISCGVLGELLKCSKSGFSFINGNTKPTFEVSWWE